MGDAKWLGWWIGLAHTGWSKTPLGLRLRQRILLLNPNRTTRRDINKIIGMQDGHICDLCGAGGDLTAVAVAPRDDSVTLCPTCTAGLSGSIQDGPHGHILHEAIWSTHPALQVLA